jgi:hypothetical protein
MYAKPWADGYIGTTPVAGLRGSHSSGGVPIADPPAGIVDLRLPERFASGLRGHTLMWTRNVIELTVKLS